MATPSASEARLTVIQITDVYTLENFPSLRTMLIEKKKENPNTISIMTGDFLAPYLLSSIDNGAGMMKMINETPIDYVSWGNHEADIPHEFVCRHVRSFRGKGWMNSNMLDHEAMAAQKEYDVVNIASADGSNSRRIGLCAVLSNDAKLYDHFPKLECGRSSAFGGATITDPWEALRKYKKVLEEQEKVDLILPLQHLYVPEDHKTCKEFDFPVIISGHDHHVVDETVEGTRLLKPGSDGVRATVLNFSWADSTAAKEDVSISAEIVEVNNWGADASLVKLVDKAYTALAPLRNTQLWSVADRFRPLSSVGARGRVCTMGSFLCTLLRTAINTDPEDTSNIDGVMLMGGNVRGGTDYAADAFFSLEALESEVKAEEEVGIVLIPGSVIEEGIRATHRGDPIPGWFQYCDGFEEDEANDCLKNVGGRPIDRERMYRIATKISDLTNGQSPPLAAYFSSGAGALAIRDCDDGINIRYALMRLFARGLWQKLWNALEFSRSMSSGDEMTPVSAKFALLDRNGDGEVSVDEIRVCLEKVLGMSIHESQNTLAEEIHSFADVSGTGTVTREDFEMFCENAGLFGEYLPQTPFKRERSRDVSLRWGGK